MEMGAPEDLLPSPMVPQKMDHSGMCSGGSAHISLRPVGKKLGIYGSGGQDHRR